MSLSGTRPLLSNAAFVWTSGTFTMIELPGLKPSARFWSVGSIPTPFLFTGVEAGLMFSRRPVSVVGSATVKWSFGHGCRQTAGSSQSQRSPLAVLIGSPKYGWAVGFSDPTLQVARFLLNGAAAD